MERLEGRPTACRSRSGAPAEAQVGGDAMAALSWRSLLWLLVVCLRTRTVLTFDASQWALPNGFAVSLYATANTARQLAISAALPTPANKTVIVYVGSGNKGVRECAWLPAGVVGG